MGELRKLIDDLKSLESAMMFHNHNLEAKTLRDAIERIKNPRQITGKWLVFNQKNVYGATKIRCSECGDDVMVQNVSDELYCRNCGAKMIGTEYEQET